MNDRESLWPTADDLTPLMRRRLDQAYEMRERKQMSKEDFSAGWVAALVAQNSKSSFKEGCWMPDGQVPW